MLTFALDTSTHSPSLAVTRGEDVLGELWLGPEPGAGRRVLEGAHHLLAALGLDFRDLERIVVGVGPGGFTGLRIGIATADALGQSIGCPVIGIVSLEALAAGLAETLPSGSLVIPAHDARRRELFAAAYLTGPERTITEVLPPVAIAAMALAERVSDLAERGAARIAAGSGALISREALAPAGVVVPPASYAAHRLRAALLVDRVAAGAGRATAPLYARLPDAEINLRRAVQAAS